MHFTAGAMDWVVLQRALLVFQTCSLYDLERLHAAKAAYKANAALFFLRLNCCLDSRVSEDARARDFKILIWPFLLQCTAGPTETMTLSVPTDLSDLVPFLHFLNSMLLLS